MAMRSRKEVCFLNVVIILKNKCDFSNKRGCLLSSNQNKTVSQYGQSYPVAFTVHANIFIKYFMTSSFLYLLSCSLLTWPLISHTEQKSPIIVWLHSAQAGNISKKKSVNTKGKINKSLGFCPLSQTSNSFEASY